MKELTEIYETLKDAGLCSTQAEFSREWLGRSDHYMAQIGGDPRKASLTSLRLLASRLELETLHRKEAADLATYRKIRGLFVAAQTVLCGVVELRHVPPYYRITGWS